ncbi:MAG: hypothetical protein R3E31_05445 [Chloroflexota bacterium]
MTTPNPFNSGCKTAPRLQRPTTSGSKFHPTGENFDTWVSGEEVMARLNTAARERLIKSFSNKNWNQAKEALRDEMDKGKQSAKRKLKDRLAGKVTDVMGDNILAAPRPIIFVAQTASF